MGARAQVHIEDTGIYLYTHWGAHDLPDLVRRVLSRRARWDDPDYLARMIFSAMIRDDLDSETGYGIGTVEVSDADLVISLNCAALTVVVKDLVRDKTTDSTFAAYIA